MNKKEKQLRQLCNAMRETLIYSEDVMRIHPLVDIIRNSTGDQILKLALENILNFSRRHCDNLRKNNEKMWKLLGDMEK